MAITLFAFMTFIIVLATKMSNIDTNLVEKDYYEKGQKFNAIYTMRTNLIKEPSALFMEQMKDFVLVRFKSGADSGYIHFYRPSDKNLDFKVVLNGEKEVRVPTSKLVRGKWMAKVLFFIDGKGYLKEESIIL